MRNLAATAGLTAGVMTGGVLTSLAVTPMQAGALPAWLLIATSILSWVWIGRSFSDLSMLPHAPPTRTPTLHAPSSSILRCGCAAPPHASDRPISVRARVQDGTDLDGRRGQE